MRGVKAVVGAVPVSERRWSARSQANPARCGPSKPLRSGPGKFPALRPKHFVITPLLRARGLGRKKPFFSVGSDPALPLLIRGWPILVRNPGQPTSISVNPMIHGKALLLHAESVPAPGVDMQLRRDAGNLP